MAAFNKEKVPYAKIILKFNNDNRSLTLDRFITPMKKAKMNRLTNHYQNK